MQWVKLSERRPALGKFVVAKVYDDCGNLKFVCGGILARDMGYVSEKIRTGEIKPEPGVPFTVDNVPIIFDIDSEYMNFESFDSEYQYSDYEFHLIEWLDEAE